MQSLPKFCLQRTLVLFVFTIFLFITYHVDAFNMKGFSKSIHATNSWKGALWPLHAAGNTGNSDPAKAYSDEADTKTLSLDNLVISLHEGIKTVDKERWDSLVTEKTSAFMEYDWLYCMEESGVATAKSGWQPLHLTVATQDSKELVAAMPLYVKYHSMGEFIFDNAWADAAYNYYGVNYYPKLLSAIPMTPATGERILLRSGLAEKTQVDLQKVLAKYLRQLVARNNLSSAHVNFCMQNEADALEKSGYMTRTSMQYHWRNSDPNNNGEKFKTFDDYLKCFTSKRRIKIKRERRSVYEDANVKMTVYHGDDIPDHLFPVMFKIYKSTIDKLYYGRQYLNEEFFKMLCQHFKRNLCFIIASDGETGDILAGTFNIVKAGRFYGRYWGGFSFVKNLHFETCYYKAIEYCIEQGLDVMEPGAGGGDFKFMRGFDPAVVKSSHYIANMGLNIAIKDFVEREAESIEEAAEYLNENSAMQGSKVKIESVNSSNRNDSAS